MKELDELKLLDRLPSKEEKRLIVKLIYQGLSKKEIAEEVGISIPLVHTIISQLRTEGILPYYSFANSDTVPVLRKTPTIREQELLDLYSENLSAKEIADAMCITLGSLKVYINRLRKKGFLSPAIKVNLALGNNKYHDKVESLVNEYLQENVDLMLNTDSENQITYINVDIAKIGEIVAFFGYRSTDVNLLVRLYVERGLYEDAIALLYKFEHANELSEEEIKQVSSLKHSLRLKMFKSIKGRVPRYVTDTNFSIIERDL